MHADEMMWVLDEDVVRVFGDVDDREPVRWGLAQPEEMDADAQGGSRANVASSRT